MMIDGKWIIDWNATQDKLKKRNMKQSNSQFNLDGVWKEDNQTGKQPVSLKIRKWFEQWNWWISKQVIGFDNKKYWKKSIYYA